MVPGCRHALAGDSHVPRFAYWSTCTALVVVCIPRHGLVRPAQVDEILDMVKPKETARISPEDLAVSGMSGIFFSILADVKQFWDYNYRENLIHQDDDQ